MKQTRTPKALATALLLISLALFFLFFAAVYYTQHNDIQAHRETREYYHLTDYSLIQIPDPTAPAGIRQEYIWTKTAGTNDEVSMAFYVSHQSVQVYIGEELVYSMAPQPDNHLTNSPGSHWVTLPLYAEDTGCRIRIVVTPHYENVISRKLDIRIGSLYTLFLQLLRENLPYVVVSFLAGFLGIAMLISLAANLILRRPVDSRIFYLGITMILLGIWRLTDTKLAPFMFHSNVLALDYISIGTLFLICIPFGLCVRYETQSPMYWFSGGCALVCLGVLGGHYLHLWDIRDCLILSHGMIVLTAVIQTGSYCVQLLRNQTREDLTAMLASTLPMLGALLDLAGYYIHNSSAEVFYVIIGFLLYSVWLYVTSLMTARKRAFTDIKTGLYNRARWEEVLLSHGAGSGDYGIVVFDLNGLKKINDTMGHDAGDRLICCFADILQKTVPSHHLLCRWGGDEFTVFAKDTSAHQLQQILLDVQTATLAFNSSGAIPAIHYAAGYAFSGEYPEFSPSALFQIADQRMYSHKQTQYCT